MAPRILFSLTVAVLVSTNLADAGNRYFYAKDGKAYYCVQPQTYSAGCYIVCDDAKVVRINQYPTITTHHADAMISSCCEPVTNTVHCGPAKHHCLPHVVDSCHCKVHGDPVPITGTQGPIKTYCDSKTFYRGIEPCEATVPVPRICVNAEEQYKFQPIELKFDCKDAHCPDLDCNFEHCKDDCCKVKTCEVYECVTNCRLECKTVPESGTVLIAVRRVKVGGQFVADVVIGKEGKMDFGAYPENTVILQAATQAQIEQHLKLDVDLSQIGGTTDLKSLIN
ncbi:MAG: hypothetical protein AAGI63_18190 [Planctomycetota bacterium]